MVAKVYAGLASELQQVQAINPMAGPRVKF